MPLSEKTLELLELYPPVFRGSTHIRGILDTHAIEIERLESTIDSLMANGNPQTADVLLSAWESLFGITVDPTGATLSARRNTLVAYFKRLNSAGSGSLWESRVNAILGSAWSYAVSNPEDVLGLWWDRYPATSTSQWTGDVGKLAVATSGISLEGSGGTVYRSNVSIPDSDQTLKFDYTSGTTLSLVGKHVNSTNRIVASVTKTKLSIWTNIGGTNTERDAKTISLTAGSTYFLRLKVIGNAITATLWSKDPSKPGNTATATSTYTLTSSGATALGLDVVGSVGFEWTGPFIVRDSKGALANVVVPDHTIRIFLPYDAGVSSTALSTKSRAQAAIREITPATTDLEYQEGEGFLLGTSLLGEQGF